MLLFICDCAEMVDLPVQCFFLTGSADLNENALKKGGDGIPQPTPYNR